MKILFSFIMMALMISACGNSDSKKDNASTMQMIDTTKLAKGTIFYQCPMHPEVVSDKAGTCPKCSMDLEPVEKK